MADEITARIWGTGPWYFDGTEIQFEGSFERLAAILSLVILGYSRTDTADAIGCSRRTVYRYLTQWRELPRRQQQLVIRYMLQCDEQEKRLSYRADGPMKFPAAVIPDDGADE